MSTSRQPAPHGRGLPPLGVLIDALYYLVNRHITAGLHDSGFPEIRVAHAKVFENLGAGCRVSELAERAQITKQSMAELVEHLERHRLVERVPDHADRRARIVRLTPRGRRAVAAAEQVLANLYDDWRDLLGRKALAELHERLDTLVTRMERKP